MPDSNMHKIFLHNTTENIFWENANFKVMFTFILASRNMEKFSLTVFYITKEAQSCSNKAYWKINAFMKQLIMHLIS